MKILHWIVSLVALVLLSERSHTWAAEPKKNSFAPVVPKEEFSETLTRMKNEKAAVTKAWGSGF